MTREKLRIMCEEIIGSLSDKMSFEDLQDFYIEEKRVWLDNLGEDEIIKAHEKYCEKDSLWPTGQI